MLSCVGCYETIYCFACFNDYMFSFLFVLSSYFSCFFNVIYRHVCIKIVNILFLFLEYYTSKVVESIPHNNY